MEFAEHLVQAATVDQREHGRRCSFPSTVGALLLVAATLLGSGVEVVTAAGAGTVPPSIALRPTQVAALDAVVSHRLNVIRDSFGLAAGQVTTAYDEEVTKAVLSNEDPPFAPLTGGVIVEGSLWGVVSGAASSPSSSGLEIVNGWVYHDGWDGSLKATWNADCTSAHAAGCDGHRRNILTTPPIRGAKLYIDVTTRSVRFDGSPALAVAALFVWKTGVTSS